MFLLPVTLDNFLRKLFFTKERSTSGGMGETACMKDAAVHAVPLARARKYSLPLGIKILK